MDRSDITREELIAAIDLKVCLRRLLAGLVLHGTSAG
jgi:hypothetical protein